MGDGAGGGPSPNPTVDGQTPADPNLLAQIQAETLQADSTSQANDPEDPGTGGIDPRTVGAKLRNAQAATTAAIGGGFQFTPEEVDAQLKLCEAQINDLRSDLQDAQQAVQQVHEPAPDDASVTQANAVKNMLNNVIEVMNGNITYLADWQNKLAAAKQTYMTNEHLTATQWIRLTQGLQA